MGAVKNALLEVEAFVYECIEKGRTLNQTIRDAEDEFSRVDNVYFINADFIEDKYYQFRGNVWKRMKRQDQEHI